MLFSLPIGGRLPPFLSVSPPISPWITLYICTVASCTALVESIFREGNTDGRFFFVVGRFWSRITQFYYAMKFISSLVSSFALFLSSSGESNSERSHSSIRFASSERFHGFSLYSDSPPVQARSVREGREENSGVLKADAKLMTTMSSPPPPRCCRRHE